MTLRAFLSFRACWIDLGFSDVGFRSNGQIHTPVIDAMAADGIVLEQYYVQDVCSPSRATFMTGRYPLHHTVNDWLKAKTPTALPLNETTLASTLRGAGYRTHAVGKVMLRARRTPRSPFFLTLPPRNNLHQLGHQWHLGFYKWAHTPTFRGFESFYGCVSHRCGLCAPCCQLPCC